MAGAVLPYINSGERVVGAANSLYADTLNRALQQALTASGHNATGTFAGLSGPMFNVVSFGADLTGAADSSAAIVLAMAAAGGAAGRIHFPPGIYKIASNLTLTSTSDIAHGATLQAANTFTVTLGRILAGDYQILDYSLGGTFKLTSGGAGQVDDFNIRWTGTKGDGTDTAGAETAAFNHAIDLCYGAVGAATRNGLPNANKNRPLYLPPGNYSVQYLDFSGTVGFQLHGAGRLVTTISINSATSVGVYGDMAAYGRMQDLIIQATVARDETHPLLDIDGKAITGGGVYPSGGSFLFPQQWTFDNVYINGNNLAAVGFNWCRLGGGNAQGDTVHIPNSFIGACTLAGFMIGSRIITAGNALDIHLVGGDVQGCPIYGIYSSGGAIHIHGTGFQNQGAVPYITASAAPTNNAGAAEVSLYNQFDQIDPTTRTALRGCDVLMHQYSTYGSIEKSRSESFVLCRDTGITRITQCDLRAGVIENWGLDNTYYKRGHIVWFDPSMNTPSLCDGRPFILVKTGTSGTGQPDTTAVARGFVSEIASVTASSATVLLPNCPPGIPSDGTWYAVIVGGRTVNGKPQKSYHPIVGSAAGASITLKSDDLVNFPLPDTTITWGGTSASTGAIVHIGQAFAEPGAGTRLWMPYDYIAMEGDVLDVDGGDYQLGQVNGNPNPVSRISPRSWFSRADMLYNFGGMFQGTFVGSDLHPRVGNGSALNKQPERSKSLNTMSTTPKDVGRRTFTGPMEFIHGSGGVSYASVLAGLYDGSFNTVPTSLTARSHTLFALKQGGFGVAPAVGTDQAGRRTDIVEGLPTGTGAGGGVAVLLANTGGGSGSTVPDAHEAVLFTAPGAGETPLWLYDPSKSAVQRVTMGAADSGGTGFKLLRVPN